MVSEAPTDFNDLHMLRGLDAVREQVLAAMDSVPVIAEDLQPVAAAADVSENQSPAPSDSVEVPRQGIDDLLKRYAWAMPDGKVWDSEQHKFLKTRSAKGHWGSKLYTQWLEHANRRTVDQDAMIPLESAAQKRGSGGIGGALRRYVYLYPSDTVWDRDKRMVVAIKDLKHAIAAEFGMWIVHPDREQVDIENLVFDPTQQVDADTHINMFRGLPLKPGEDMAKCANIVGLVRHLCNKDDAVVDWLFKWLAYPLQHVGAKMDTAVMMHSDKQGSGKSLLFGGVLRKVYGEYGATLGQHQLESQYTDWRSNMLFGLFEEVLGRDQKYSHTGTIKHMITGETHRIEKKFVSGWEEANHMNAVFLSNEIQPFPIEETDRRMMVIWPESTLPDEDQKTVAAELDGGGIEAFYHFLLSYPLDDFTPHTKPVMTEAKERLIDFGRAAWDVFYRDWVSQSLPWDVPYETCLAMDLFKVYRAWCNQRHEKVITMTRFGGFIGSRLKRRRNVEYQVGTATKVKGTFFMVTDVPDGATQKLWLGECVKDFRQMMPSLGADDL